MQAKFVVPAEFRLHPMMKYFEFEHLPSHLKSTSVLFYNLALRLDVQVDAGIMKDRMFDDLLRAKDCAVRAAVDQHEGKLGRHLPLDVEEEPEDTEPDYWDCHCDNGSPYKLGGMQHKPTCRFGIGKEAVRTSHIFDALLVRKIDDEMMQDPLFAGYMSQK